MGVFSDIFDMVVSSLSLSSPLDAIVSWVLRDFLLLLRRRIILFLNEITTVAVRDDDDDDDLDDFTFIFDFNCSDWFVRLVINS